MRILFFLDPEEMKYDHKPDCNDFWIVYGDAEKELRRERIVDGKIIQYSELEYRELRDRLVIIEKFYEVRKNNLIHLSTIYTHKLSDNVEMTSTFDSKDEYLGTVYSVLNNEGRAIMHIDQDANGFPPRIHFNLYKGNELDDELVYDVQGDIVD